MRALLLAILAFALLVPAVADARNNVRQSVMAQTEVSTAGGAVTATIDNIGHQTGYLIVKTENETGTASLVVTVTIEDTLGDVLICTSTAITTNTTTNILIGSTAAAAEGITDACDFPAGRELNVIFTVSGADSDFDVTAAIQWASP